MRAVKKTSSFFEQTGLVIKDVQLERKYIKLIKVDLAVSIKLLT